MAFKIGNQTVIRDIDATAAIETNSNLDKLQINGTDVLTHDGSTITLKNVNIDDLMESSINTDNVIEGSTNLFHTTARVEQLINANKYRFPTTHIPKWISQWLPWLAMAITEILLKAVFFTATSESAIILSLNCLM